MRAALLAAFGEQQLLVGPGVVDLLHVIEAVLAVPVEAGAPHIARGGGIRVHRVRPLDHQVTVVVPDHDLHSPEAGGLEFRSQVVAHEVTLFLGRVQARIPALRGQRFVLHRHAPDRHAFRLVRLDEADVAARPRARAIRAQLAAVVHPARGLHPRRRAPRRGEQLERRARHALRRADERQQCLPVAFDAEARQRQVVRGFDVGVVAEREVAAAHVHPAQRVAVSARGIEAGLEHLLAVRFAQPEPGDRRGLGEGAAEALELLERAAGIDDHRRQPGFDRPARPVPGCSVRRSPVSRAVRKQRIDPRLCTAVRLFGA